MRDLNTNHKKPIITLIIAALVVFAGGTAGMLHALKNDDTKADQKVAASTPAGKPEVKAAETTVIEFTAVKDKTVLEQLQSKAKVEVKDSQYGPYVDSINGVKGGTDNKYWSYYVNGQMANIGAGEYVAKGGETVTWKFE
jgi:hypothetical protein